jgi:hypothetical protein
MKIKRQDSEESYSTNIFWLQEFAEKLHKRSYENSIEKQEEVLASTNNRFATIEEKMADIKNRIGFDLITKNNVSDDSVKTASCHCDSCHVSGKNCGSNKVATYSEKNKEIYVRKMNNVLKYIKDLCKHEYNRLTTPMVIARCKEEIDLHFDSIPLNLEKLEKYIDSILDRYKKSEQENISYIPIDKDRINIDENRDAEYWSHAFPKK